MEGHFYTRRDIDAVFGADAGGYVFLYTGCGSERPQLYLQIAPDSLKWFCLHPRKEVSSSARSPVPETAQEIRGYAVALAEPVFQLLLSSNLSVRNDFDRTLSSCGFLPLPDGLMDVAMQPAYGYRMVHPSFTNPIEKPPEATKQPLVFGALFLDFLFDLRHSRVFEYCPAAAGIDTGLLGHPLANAIHDKVEYLWHRKLYRDMQGRDGGEQARKLLAAEGEWLDTCMEPGAQEILSKGGLWFDAIEDEVRRVVFAADQGDCADCHGDKWDAAFRFRRELCKFAAENCRGSDEDIRRGRFERVAGWFLYRYDLNAAAATHLLHLSGLPRCDIAGNGWLARWLTRSIRRLPTRLCALSLLVVLFLLSCDSPLFLLLPVFGVLLVAGYRYIRNASNRENATRCIGRCLVFISKWLSGTVCAKVRRRVPERWIRKGWNSCKAFPVWLARTLAPHFRTMRTVLPSGVQAAEIPDGGRQKLPYTPVSMIVGSVLGGAACVLMGASLGVFAGGGNQLRVGVMTAMIYLPVAFLFLALGYAGARVSYLRLHRKADGSAGLGAMLIAVRLSLPRLVFAITSAWMMMYVDDVCRLINGVGRLEILCVGGAALAVSLIFTLVKVHHITQDSVRSFGRSLLAISVAMVISIYIGLISMSILGPNSFFPKDGDPFVKPGFVIGALRTIYEGSLFEWPKIHVYPSMLLYHACIAVFFGIFLQLIFGDKEMTESL